jgi:hypothetical protein
VLGAARAHAAPAWHSLVGSPTRGRTPEEPQIAINAAGEAIAVWEDEANDDASLIQIASRSPLGTWSKPVNEVVALWEREGDNFRVGLQSASRPPGGAWSRPGSVYKKKTYADVFPQIVINNAGEAIAVWEGFAAEPALIQSAQGAKIVEAYPVDVDSPSYRFMGFVPAFEKAGFEPTGQREGKRRHLMRLELTP